MDWSVIAAVVGVVTGAAGAVCGVAGLVQASRSNTTAEEALELARQAESRNDQLAAIELEHRDVDWQRDSRNTDSDARLSYENRGTTVAKDVTLTVRVADLPPRQNTVDEVPPGGFVGLNLRTEVREYTEWWRSETLGGQMAVSHLPTPEVSVRLTWHSPAGKPDSLTETFRL